MAQDLREKALRRADMTQEDVSRGIEARAAARKVPSPSASKPRSNLSFQRF